MLGSKAVKDHISIRKMRINFFRTVWMKLEFPNQRNENEAPNTPGLSHWHKVRDF
jgi:hypothetical protein